MPYNEEPMVTWAEIETDIPQGFPEDAVYAHLTVGIALPAGKGELHRRLSICSEVCVYRTSSGADILCPGWVFEEETSIEMAVSFGDTLKKLPTPKEIGKLRIVPNPGTFEPFGSPKDKEYAQVVKDQITRAIKRWEEVWERTEKIVDNSEKEVELKGTTLTHGRALAVIGSRSLAGNTEAMGKAKRGLRELIHKARITSFVSGGAQGPDLWGEDVARSLSLKIVIHHPDWKRDGRSAGFKRNELIIRDADLMVVFHDGASRGTLHSVNLAREKGIPILLLTWTPEKGKWTRKEVK